MFHYTGSGPYCYTHALAMLLGQDAPPAAVIETLTGAPFGFAMVGGTLPLFDPYGWNPEIGLEAAIDSLGWRCAREAGGTATRALDRLRAACEDGPVLAGPLDMRMLSYQSAPPPDGGPDEDAVDHYLVVLAVTDETVLVHDPQGFPYATLPVADFLRAWRAERVSYAEEPFVSRTAFDRDRVVRHADALRGSLPGAVDWLSGRTDLPMPDGSLHGADAVRSLADQLRAGLDAEIRELLVEFGVRVGARRLTDAAGCLHAIGLRTAGEIADEQARTVGALQHPLVRGDDAAVIAGLSRLAPSYGRLRTTLAAALSRSAG